MCFGGSSGASQAALNQQAHHQQQQQIAQAQAAAQQAQQAAAQRAAQLQAGVNQINTLFNAAAGDDELFQVYQDAINNVYLPDLQQQFTGARRNLKAASARQGQTGGSTAINRQFADITGRRAAEEGRLRQEAESGAGDLRARIEQERQRALSTLYNTQSPQAGLNTAYAALSNVRGAQPQFDPLGDVFQVAALTGAKAAESGGFFGDDRSGQFNLPSIRPRQAGRTVG